jgi:hypothetical protein
MSERTMALSWPDSWHSADAMFADRPAAGRITQCGLGPQAHLSARTAGLLDSISETANLSAPAADAFERTRLRIAGRIDRPAPA